MKILFLSKRENFLLFFLFVILIFLRFTSAEVGTTLEIINAPPYLIKDIPDQSWPENESLIDAFDLDEYFGDQEGTPLTYYNSSVSGIYVEINPITHTVSFYPAPGFSGKREVTFYASDSKYDSPSNVVTLSVGLDKEPPKWFFPGIDKEVIYQSDLVTFTTNWTDDRNLKEFIFSINQGAGWENYSSTFFSGKENISSSKIQIRAPAFNIVYWRYYASDSSGNINVTDIQSFTVSLKETGEGPGSGSNNKTSGGLSNLFQNVDVSKARKIEDFQINIYELRVQLKQGESKTRLLKITNTGLEEIFINLSSPKLQDFVVFSSSSFSLPSGKSKEIALDFHAKDRTIPGQYFGYITLSSRNVSKSIPTVLDIQGINLEFDVTLNISEEYKIVKPGKEIKVNMTLKNLKDLKDTKISLYYAIKDYFGTVYNFSEEDATLFSTLSLERTLLVPEGTPKGKYLVYVRASDDKNIAIDSVEFEVGTKFSFSSFIKIGSISLLITIFALFLAILMVKRRKDKEKERILELYILLNKLKSLIKQNKEDEALDLFIKIKKMYREPLPKDIFDDKEKLKKEISLLYDSFLKDKNISELNKNVSKNLVAQHPPANKNEKPFSDKSLEFLQEQRKKGLTDSQIKKFLLNKGFSEEEVGKIFNSLNNKSNINNQVKKRDKKI